MSAQPRKITILDGATNQPVEAQLVDAIDERNIGHVLNDWKPEEARLLEGKPKELRDQSAHWDWVSKLEAYPELTFHRFAIERDDMTQCLMMTCNSDIMHRCKLPEQDGKPLVYVEYAQNAPWNRANLVDPPRYRAIGMQMMVAAIRQSLEEEFEGRVGLHALPQSVGFYERCGMTHFVAGDKRCLAYFEFTPHESGLFLARFSPT